MIITDENGNEYILTGRVRITFPEFKKEHQMDLKITTNTLGGILNNFIKKELNNTIVAQENNVVLTE